MAAGAGVRLAAGAGVRLAAGAGVRLATRAKTLSFFDQIRNHNRPAFRNYSPRRHR